MIKTINGSFRHCHSWGGQTAVESFYWHDEAAITILSFVLKSESEGHNVIKVLDGDMFFFLFAHVLGIEMSIKAKILWANSGERSPTPNLHTRTPLSCYACTVSLALISHHPFRAKGKYQLWKLSWLIIVQSSSVFSKIGATGTYLVEAKQSFICVLFGI